MTYQAPPKISKSRYNKEFLLTYDDDSEDFGKKSKGRKRSKKQEPKTG